MRPNGSVHIFEWVWSGSDWAMFAGFDEASDQEKGSIASYMDHESPQKDHNVIGQIQIPGGPAYMIWRSADEPARESIQSIPNTVIPDGFFEDIWDGHREEVASNTQVFRVLEAHSADSLADEDLWTTKH